MFLNFTSSEGWSFLGGEASRGLANTRPYIIQRAKLKK